MGLLDLIRRSGDIGSVALESPWASPNHLQSIVWADLLGVDYAGPVTRADAMKIPAVVRGRGLIVTTIARSPLVAERQGADLADPPRWINRTSGPVSPFHRMLWTADDLLFFGWSLWAARRDFDGAVIEADRVSIDRWEFTPDGEILIDGNPVDDREVILIPGIHEGILSFGDETIRQARGLLMTAERAATNPAAMIELSQTNEYPITEKEIEALIARWSAARRGDNGGVAFTSAGIETKEHGAAKEHLLIEGRSASSIDIARLLGIPASMIDANQAGSSLSYSNTESRMSELISFGIAPLMAAIAARLSLDDVAPRGTEIRFNTRDIVATLATEGDDAAGPTGPPTTTPSERGLNNG